MALGIVELAEELALWTTNNCQPFEPTFVAHVLSGTRYTGILTTLFLYLAGIRYCEIYLLFFGYGSTINMLINIIARAIIADTTRASPLCVDTYELAGNWPSYQSQEAAFLTTFLLTYAVVYRARFHALSAVCLLAFFAAVVAADLLLNYHTFSQVVGAVMLGAAHGLEWQVVFRFMMYPHVRTILKWNVAQYFEYQDTLCLERDEEPKNE